MLKFARSSSTVILACVLLGSCQGLQFEELDWQGEYFTPSARIYFDTGKDDDDEVDVYRDGALTAAVDFVGLTKPFLIKKASPVKEAELQLEQARLGAKLGGPAQEVQKAEVEQRQLALDFAQSAEKNATEQRNKGKRLDGDWVLGLRGAMGFTSPAGDSEDGATEASGAPVLFVSASIYLDLYKSGGTITDDDSVGVRLEFGTMLGISADESLGNADDSALFVGLSVFL